MAANGEQGNFSPADVLSALTTMKSGEQEAKKKAHQYLENFQKSVRIDGAVHCTDSIDADNVYRKAHGER
jgi:transportin-3